MDYTHPIRRRARGPRQIASVVVGAHRVRRAAFSLQETVAHAAAAPQSPVETAADALEAIGRLPEVLGELPRFPQGVLRVIAGRAGVRSR